MTILRVGLGENKKFAAGYDVIFGKKKTTPAKKASSSKAKKTNKAKTKKN